MSRGRDDRAPTAIFGTEIIEQGTHEELLAQKGFYEHLYMSQFKGQHEDDGKVNTLEKTSTHHYA